MINYPENLLDINYLNHPAFKTLNRKFIFPEDEINSVIGDTNSLFIFLSKHPNQIKNEIIRNKINSQFEKIELIINSSINDIYYKDIFSKIILEAKLETIYQIDFFSKQVDYKPRNLDSFSKEHYLDLIKDGFSYIKFDLNDVKNIKKIGIELLEDSRNFYKDVSNWRGARSLSPYSDSGAYFINLLKKYKIKDIISNYKNVDMSLHYLGLDYSNERQTWFKNCYADIGLPLNKSNYFHFDNDINVCKMMIYLNDVDYENGPFQIIKKSTTFSVNQIYKNFSSAVDRVLGRSVTNTTEPLDYYRPLFKDHRQIFINLPICLQRTTHFGDDILDNDPRANFLEMNSEVVRGQAGSALIFDGYSGIHKGSTVQCGERLGLQVAFIEKNHYSKIEQFKKFIRESSFMNKNYSYLKTKKLI